MTLRRKLVAFQIAVIVLPGAVIAVTSYEYHHRGYPRQLEGLAAKTRLCVTSLAAVAGDRIAADDLPQLRRDLRLCNPARREAPDPELRFAAVLNERGKLLASVGQPPDDLLDLGPAPAGDRLVAPEPALIERPDGLRSGARLVRAGRELGSVWAEYSTEQIQAGRRLFVIHSSFGLLFAALSMVVSIIFAVRVVQPLRQMIGFVHRVAKGDFEARLSITAGDELAVLAEDLNRMTTEMARSHQQLLQSEKMAAFGQLAAGVAHEINNPSQFIFMNFEQLRAHLQSVTAFVDRLRRAPDDDERRAIAGERETDHVLHEIREILDESALGFSRIVNIVDNLRSFSHKGERGQQRFDIRQALEPALRIVRNEIQQRGQLVTEIPEGLEVRGNPSQLSQVFLNLLVNAVQALGQQAYQRNQVKVRARTVGGEWVEVAVSDTGQGIPADKLPRIFEPFFTTKAKEKGTGLGLTISQQIVVSHDGQISVQSDPGRGTTFTVRLPRAQGGATEATEKVPAVDLQTTRPARVLVIDDEEHLLRSLRRILGRRHEVQTTDSGEEALQLFARREPFDVVLCDLLMPEMTGMEVYERACRIDPGLKDRFLFMSGNAFTEQSREFAQTFKDRILSKPFDIQQLERLLQGRLGPSAPPAAAA